MLTPAVHARVAWDDFDVYLFDIDGTLLHCTDAVHYFAFCHALHLLTGRALNLDGVVTQGNVDNGILRDALQLAGIHDDVWRGRLEEAQQAMCAHVEQHREDFRIEVLPGVMRLLQHLRGRGAHLGTATGNLRRIGEAKLNSADLLHLFHFGGWSDLAETRADVFRRAIAAVRQAYGADASICVVGDTPQDVSAAHANGLPVIAVATGIYDGAQLRAAGADVVVSTLQELFEREPQLPRSC